MRIRVVLDVTSPLKIDRKVRQPGGEWLRGKYRYEKLPTFCFVCGRIGHVERHCAITYRTPAEEIVRKWDASLRADVRRPTQQGGEQWLVQSQTLHGLGGESAGRVPLPNMQVHDTLPRRVIPVSVLAARRNLGVSITRPLELFEDEEKVHDDMEGVELNEVKKRRRGRSVEADRGDGASSRQEDDGRLLHDQECHISSKVVLAGPMLGTCPPQ
ncbi:hypothetical protein LINGRAHAP2_LOCUS15920 [Linum grandiflorum]